MELNWNRDLKILNIKNKLDTLDPSQGETLEYFCAVKLPVGVQTLTGYLTLMIEYPLDNLPHSAKASLH